MAANKGIEGCNLANSSYAKIACLRPALVVSADSRAENRCSSQNASQIVSQIMSQKCIILLRYMY